MHCFLRNGCLRLAPPPLILYLGILVSLHGFFVVIGVGIAIATSVCIFIVICICVRICILICIVFFTALLVDTVKKYSQKMTNIGIIIEESSKEEKMPMERFQEPGFTLLH